MDKMMKQVDPSVLEAMESVERKFTRLFLVAATGFMVAWMPFCLLCIWELATPPNEIPTSMFTLLSSASRAKAHASCRSVEEREADRKKCSFKRSFSALGINQHCKCSGCRNCNYKLCYVSSGTTDALCVTFNCN